MSSENGVSFHRPLLVSKLPRSGKAKALSCISRHPVSLAMWKGNLFLVLVSLFASAVWADEEPKSWNLEGISSFRLVVEELSRDAVQAGITEDRIRSQVAAHLKGSLPELLILEKDGAAALYIRVVLYKRKADDLYYGMIGVSVDRAVMILSAGGNFPGFSQIWEKTAVFSGGEPLLGTFEILSKLLNVLAKDFKEANPPK